MLTWQKLKTDEKFQNVYPYTPKQLKAMEEVAVRDGELLQPLVVWDGTLIFGYPCLDILREHDDLKYKIIEKSFDNWEDAKVWAVEHYICLPEILLAQKLMAAIQCEGYWKLKEAAKAAQGTRTDLSSDSEEKSQSTAVNAIIARKVGCSETYVYNFKRIHDSGNQTIIDQCLKGTLTISAAYAKLFSTTKKGGERKPKPDPNAKIELEIDTVDLLRECEQDDDLGLKRSRISQRIPVDPMPIAQEIKVSRVPDGSLWIAVYLKEGQLQVVKRVHDEEMGCYHVMVNCFDCRLVSQSEDMIVLQADHICGSAEEFHSKDEPEFDEINHKQIG